MSHSMLLVHSMIPLLHQGEVTIKYLMSACLILEHTRVVFLPPFISRTVFGKPLVFISIIKHLLLVRSITAFTVIIFPKLYSFPGGM